MKAFKAGMLAAAVVMALAASMAAAAAPIADDILKRADLVRGPDYSRSLVEFVAPPRDAGRKMLRVSENMWVRIPASRRAIRITPQQRLLGQASNSDVMGTNYAGDYSAQLLGEEAVTPFDGGAPVNCYKLELTKKTSAASYHHLTYWVAKESYHPIRSEFYTQTGRLLKTAHFTRYANALGAVRPGRVVIVNAVNKEEFTVLDIVAYGKSSLPVAEYTEAALH
jgi:hypothetical protein